MADTSNAKGSAGGRNYCAVCHGVLIEHEHTSETTLLFCTNCGLVYARNEHTGEYKFLGATSGNNEIREVTR